MANQTLTSLLSRTNLDDHEAYLKAASQTLNTTPTDLQAQQTKLTALLKLDRYAEAVSFIESSNNSSSTLKSLAGFEYAYALYKVGNLALAAETARKVSTSTSDKNTRGAQHVEAQARYRLEEYERTAKIYEDLIATQDGSEGSKEHFLKANRGAIEALGQWLGLLDGGSARRPDRDDLAAFETAYNAACGSIARGELSQAEVLLKRAKTLCQHAEELTEQEKKEELGPILVQQAYVLHRRGKIAEAEAVAKEIVVDELTDLGTRRVALNNSLLNSGETSNPFVVYKAFNNTPTIPESDRLFSYQSIPLLSNEKTLELNTFKFQGLSKTSKQNLSTQDSRQLSPDALLLSSYHAASLAKNEVGKAAINNVLPELQQRPADLGLVMTLAQMYILVGNTTSAIDVVEAYSRRLEESNSDADLELRYHPGLVSVFTALYKLQGRKGYIRRELAKAASYWKSKSRAPTTLLRAAGISLLASSTSEDAQIANEIFDKLYKEQPNDKATIAGYVASHALSDPDSVQKLAEKLKPVSELVSGVDVSSLETVGIPQASNALVIAQQGTSRKRAVPTGAEVGRKKRIRKSRLPKGHEPGSDSKPDPERWLPMRDRSYYRPPKGKKKGKKADDRTQGGAVSEDLDVSKQTTSTAKGGEIVSGGGGGGAGKKKKGKGKK